MIEGGDTPIIRADVDPPDPYKVIEIDDEPTWRDGEVQKDLAYVLGSTHAVTSDSAQFGSPAVDRDRDQMTLEHATLEEVRAFTYAVSRFQNDFLSPFINYVEVFFGAYKVECLQLIDYFKTFVSITFTAEELSSCHAGQLLAGIRQQTAGFTLSERVNRFPRSLAFLRLKKFVDKINNNSDFVTIKTHWAEVLSQEYWKLEASMPGPVRCHFIDGTLPAVNPADSSLITEASVSFRQLCINLAAAERSFAIHDPNPAYAPQQYDPSLFKAGGKPSSEAVPLPDPDFTV